MSPDPGKPTIGRRALRALAAATIALATTATLLAAPSPVQAQANSVTVNFNTNLGAPVQLASGTLYGITQNGANPPDQFLTGIGFNSLRAGGSQLNNPGGWAWNEATYVTRWNSTLAQYRRATAHDANFVIIVNDLWGRDATWNAPYPGDNGDWSSYDAFLNRLISDVQAAGINPQWDIWNEPDISLFWDRPQSQYLEMWQRGYQRIRQSLPNATIVGPSTASSPPGSSGWWNTYLNLVASTNTVPDIISWHSLGGIPSVDPTVARQTVDGWLSQRGISPRPYQINEYAGPSQQNPGQGAWYIARLERNNIEGLRANWGSGPNGLHNNLAELLVQSGGQYQPKGEWILYREYASMGGVRVSVTPGSVVDGFATRDAGTQQARVLLGRAGGTGTTTVNLTGLNATNLVQNGQVRVVLQQVPHNNDGVVNNLVNVSDQTVSVSNNNATLSFSWTNAQSAYLVTLLPPGGGDGGGPQPGVSYQLIAQHSGLALDIEEASTSPGARLIQWTPHSAPNQRFQFVSIGDGYYRIVAQHSGHALEVFESNPSNGAEIVQSTDINGSNQQWQVINHGGGVISIVNRFSGRALDVWDNATNTGARVSQWDYHGEANQRFQLVTG